MLKCNRFQVFEEKNKERVNNSRRKRGCFNNGYCAGM